MGKCNLPLAVWVVQREFVNQNADQADVDRVLAGDADAFENIVRRWQAPLINLAYRFSNDRARAEDMAQEAFLRAFRALKQWRQDAAFSTWLFALAINLYRSELRRIPPRATPLDVIAEPADTRGGASPDAERARERVVRRAVQALPEKYRDALTLFYFHEQDLAEAARSLGVPEGTLKARLSRGRELLRAKLPRLLEGVD